MRLIDGDALFKQLKDIYDMIDAGSEELHFSLDDMEMNIASMETIVSIETIQPEQQWIPVSSGKFPKIKQKVLCQCRGGIQEVLRLTDDGDAWKSIYPRTIYMKSFVVAWMPLPEPWKGEE